jgi:hypothetical protein
VATSEITFAPTDLTDNRPAGDWKSRYEKEAWRSITLEAIYLSALFVGVAVLCLVIWLGIVDRALGLVGQRSITFRHYGWFCVHRNPKTCFLCTPWTHLWTQNVRLPQNPFGHYRRAYLHVYKIFRSCSLDDSGTGGKSSYLPMQNLLKMRLRMSSVVVVPVRVSREWRAS